MEPSNARTLRPTHGEANLDAVGAPLDGRFSYRIMKRGFDLVVASLALLVLSPVLALVGMLVICTSGAPVLYAWNVIGRGGRPFRGYKFRTMVRNADRLKAQLAQQNEATGPVFKMKHDPRVTPVGRILRKFSLDELPQLWSVLKGDMSLVGPRPVLTYEWEQFTTGNAIS